MKILAILRDRATTRVEVTAADVASLRAAALAQRPADYELTELLNGGRVDGDLVGTAVFRATATSELEAAGRSYAEARSTLEGLVPPTKQVLSVRVTSDLEG